MGRPRQYRFEVEPNSFTSPSIVDLPGKAERPGRYPAIMISTTLGEFAIVDTVERPQLGNVHYDAHFHLHQAQRPRDIEIEPIDRNAPIPRTSSRGPGLIALGKPLQRILSKPNVSSHEFATRPLNTNINGDITDVIMRGDLAWIADSDHDPEEGPPLGIMDDVSMYDPFFAMSEAPICAGTDHVRRGVRINPVNGAHIGWTTGHIVVPSLLKAKYRDLW